MDHEARRRGAAEEDAWGSGDGRELLSLRLRLRLLRFRNIQAFLQRYEDRAPRLGMRHLLSTYSLFQFLSQSVEITS